MVAEVEEESDRTGSVRPIPEWQFRAVYFTMYAAFGVLSPYLALFFQTKEFSKANIGILCFIPNVCTVVFGPIFSTLADKMHKHEIVMVSSLLLGIVFTLCMLYVHEGLVLAMASFVLLGAIVRAPLTSIYDSSVIAQVGSNRFGEFRLFGAASFGIFSLIGGISITPSGDKGVSSNFAPLFLCNALLASLAALLIVKIARGKSANVDSYGVVDVTSRHESVVTDHRPSTDLAPSASESGETTADHVAVVPLIIARFRQLCPQIVCFFMVALISGVADGIIDAFLFVRLAELGGSGVLCGIGRFITCASEVVVFKYAGILYDKLGCWRCLALTQVAFVLRLSGYLLLTRSSVWCVVILEALNGVTFALTWQTACMYSAVIAPRGAESTMQALLESVHWGLGSGLGALGAGFVYHHHGAETLFSGAAFLCCFSLAFSLVGVVRFPEDHKSLEEKSAQLVSDGVGNPFTRVTLDEDDTEKKPDNVK